jgi:transketolase
MPGRALRAVVGEAIAAMVNEDPRVVVLDGDVGSSTGVELLEETHPDRFFQMGIAEQNQLGVAAGMATVGFVPVVSAFACFAVGRAFDSIRVLIDQPQLNVKITGGYTGLLTGMTGKTHQMFNDIAIMRSLPNMTVLAPADEVEARQAVRAMIATPGPCYMQVTREASPILFGADYQFEIGKAVLVRTGTDATVVSTGVQTTRVVEAAELLDVRGLSVAVLHVPTIKPLDATALVGEARRTGRVIVVEEQSVLGGLGGAVAEVLAERYPVHVSRLGIMDCYGESGPNEALLDRFRLSPPLLADDIESILTAARREPAAAAPSA